MDRKVTSPEKLPTPITIEDVNRVLEVGRLLFSVLTEEEIKDHRRVLNVDREKIKMGNPSVT